MIILNTFLISLVSIVLFVFYGSDNLFDDVDLFAGSVILSLIVVVHVLNLEFFRKNSVQNRIKKNINYFSLVVNGVFLVWTGWLVYLIYLSDRSRNLISSLEYSVFPIGIVLAFLMLVFSFITFQKNSKRIINYQKNISLVANFSLVVFCFVLIQGTLISFNTDLVPVAWFFLGCSVLNTWKILKIRNS